MLHVFTLSYTLLHRGRIIDYQSYISAHRVMNETVEATDKIKCLCPAV